MGSLSITMVSPTADSMALNAGMYGFADHSMLTPHASLKQMWWTDERISNLLTSRYVAKQVKGAERDSLNKPIDASSDLTDDTYMDWILNRAQRLFLALSHVNCAEKIFTLIDDSWQDEDLPIPRSDVKRLELSLENDEKLNRRFYEAQFYYLLRKPGHGEHIEYGPCEHIPMDNVQSMPAAASVQSWSRVHLPEEQTKVLTRRKFDLSEEIGALSHKLQFLEDVECAQSFSHEHIAPVWASYSTDDAAYVLSDFVAEHSLRTFMEQRTAPQYMRLPEEGRPCLLLEWMHCLADAVTYIHSRGEAHGNIRPSNILIDQHNCIAFSDVGHLATFSRDKIADKHELKDYTPPEFALTNVNKGKSASSNKLTKQSSTTNLPDLSAHRRRQVPTLSLVSTATGGSSAAQTTPTETSRTSPASSRSRNFSRPTTISAKDVLHETDDGQSPGKTYLTPPATPSSSTSGTGHEHGDPLTRVGSSPSLGRIDISPTEIIASFPPPPRRLPIADQFMAPERLPTPPAAFRANVTSAVRSAPVRGFESRSAPQQGDIFSLGCIFLDLLSFLLHGRITDFVKFRRKSGPPPAVLGESSYLALSPSSDAASFSNSSAMSKKTAITAFTGFAMPDPKTAAESCLASESKVDVWLDRLRLSALRAHPKTDLPAATAQLSALIRRMLDRDPSARPSARQVRDSLEGTLIRICGMDGLCCEGRKWHTVSSPTEDPRKDRSLQEALARVRDEVDAHYAAQGHLLGAAIDRKDSATATSADVYAGTLSSSSATELPAAAFSDDSSVAEVPNGRPASRKSIAGWKMGPLFKRNKKGPSLRMP